MTEPDRTTRRVWPRSQPAWQTVAEIWAGSGSGTAGLSPVAVERARPLDRHIQRNSDAEYAFYRLHGRFHRYAEEALFPDERILAYVPWTAAVAASWPSRVGRWLAPGGRQAAEGMLVVTDRQVLLLHDAAEPEGKTLHWGYAVHATTPERLAGVTVAAQPGGSPVLQLDLAAGAARETIAWTFPAAAAGEVVRAGQLLDRFVPRPGEHHPRRVGHLGSVAVVDAPAMPGRGSRHAEPCDPAMRAALDARLAEVLGAHPAPDGGPRRVRMAAIIPSVAADEPTRLLALTQEHLALIPERGDATLQALSEITSAEVRHSVLGSHVAWTVGAGASAAGRTIVPFPVVSLPACLAVFAALRQALTLLPVEAAGPDLPEAEATGEQPAGE